VTRGPSGPSQASGAQRRRKLWEQVVLLGPGYAYLLVFFIVPLALIVSLAFFRRGRFGGVVYEPSLANFERALEPVFVQVLIDSVVIAGVTTILALLIGYPTAWVIARLSPRWRVIALILIVLPFWTNFLIRTYAWILLLNNEGIVNGALRGAGLIEAPLGFLYTDAAIVVGLLYAYLPLMILPLFASIERLDPEMREAAANLGATPARVFLTVTLPLTLPGVLIGCIFVFVPSIGNFIVPELLGGGKTIMVGNLIRDQFLKARDWPFGAVLAIVVIVGLIALLVLQSWLSRRSEAVADA
jgi:spermidine/putrescine transport system permease protein